MRILIVGGGIAGSLSAIHLGKENEVVVVEEHQSAGFPVQCAGLISEECYNILSNFSKRCYINKIDGAFFFSPNGDYLELYGKRRGVVIERKILDFDLISKASENANILMKTKYISSNGKKAKLRSDSGEMFLEYDFLIGADGTYSRVSSEYGFRKPEVLSAIQFEANFECLDENMVELYFGSEYSSGFFAYAIPLDSTTARIGVVTKASEINAVHYLKNLIEKHPSASIRFGKAITELNAGSIPVGLNEIVRENVCLIGDSAGMTKPYTGGGIYYLLKAVECLSENFPSLNRFKQEYLNRMGKEYEFGMKIYRLYSKLSDRDYNELLSSAKGFEGYARELDMDRPSSILKVLPAIMKLLFKSPTLYLKIGKEFLIK
ncbi:geranylgeranyl reductase family [Archaeoglobus sulfaticallidus PM70-1]|uniref:Geranylgeranyl reductase family n=1 Tax=Archaeoglobus sulfaticallidus PM70-1 TaxID=387631 RepID=N0BD60_9EURY|nr:NAD(P)/FAD-dependent oxidoreductase [Archaeoglobus sulfaticallidus]AGK60182.1 geranylgeranyl reductase family [Archaeoglobus sulfaticallidus PM70-1]